MLNENFDTIKAVFLLLIAVSGNFLGNTLNCGLQYYLTNNAILRNVFLFMMIIFTIDFTAKNSMNVLQLLKKASVIYLLYWLIVKQNRYMIIFIFSLLVIIYLLYLQSEYYKSINDIKNKNNIDDIINNLLILLLSITVLGSLYYATYQYMEYREKFNLISFIFGNNVCSRLR